MVWWLEVYLKGYLSHPLGCPGGGRHRVVTDQLFPLVYPSYGNLVPIWRCWLLISAACARRHIHEQELNPTRALTPPTPHWLTVFYLTVIGKKLSFSRRWAGLLLDSSLPVPGCALQRWVAGVSRAVLDYHMRDTPLEASGLSLSYAAFSQPLGERFPFKMSGKRTIHQNNHLKNYRGPTTLLFKPSVFLFRSGP